MEQSKDEQFEEIYNDADKEKEFLLKAPTHDVFMYTDWKTLRAQRGKDQKYFKCAKCTRTAFVMVSPGDIANCSYCSLPMEMLDAPKISAPDVVSVPYAYDKRGVPIKGKNVMVTRRAAESWGRMQK